MSDDLKDLKARLRSGVIGSDNGARLEHEAADEIERLEAELKNQAFMSSHRPPATNDTYVETWMSADLWREFRPVPRRGQDR